MQNVIIYTDGSCINNPGPGGWAAILFSSGKSKELKGGFSETTNNEMELYAVLSGIEALTKPCNVIVFTDSKLVIGWLSQGYKTKAENIKILVNEIFAAIEKGGHTVTYQKVKAHADNELNERCDELAKIQAMLQALTTHPVRAYVS